MKNKTMRVKTMTEQNIELLQQRISHLEKLADDAGKTLTFQQSRIDLLTAERDQLIEKNNKLVAENVGLINSSVNTLQDGRPSHGFYAKLHGLRMLNPLIFTKLPLASADSTNVARNIGIDKAWSGAYSPASKETRAALMVERIESYNSPGSLIYCEIRDRFDMQLQLAV